MMHKYCFEVVDRTFRDILRKYNKRSQIILFGGKIVVLVGYFCWILPVIPKESSQ